MYLRGAKPINCGLELLGLAWEAQWATSAAAQDSMLDQLHKIGACMLDDGGYGHMQLLQFRIIN